MPDATQPDNHPLLTGDQAVGPAEPARRVKARGMMPDDSIPPEEIERGERLERERVRREKREGLAESVAANRFRRVSAAELAQPPLPVQWLIKNVWPDGAYGVYGGAKKTLKTYMTLAMAVSVASGKPFLDTFAVPEPRPVLMYLSEGGQQGTMRRLQDICKWMEVDLATLPLTIVFDSAPIGSEMLTGSIKDAIADLDPGLVVLDAVYAFNAENVDSQDLYSRGPMFAAIQHLVVGPRRALILVDHFSKQRANQLDLSSVSQAGVSEWSHSWGLVIHRSAAQVATGRFYLQVQFAGRDGYGADYDVDWDLGLEGVDGLHGGPLQVTVSRSGAGTGARMDPVDKVTPLILQVVKSEPFELTKTQIRERVMKAARVGEAKVNAAWGSLEADGRIVSQAAPGAEGKRRPRWGEAQVQPRTFRSSTPSKVKPPD